jgi:hypothetical protein
LRFAAELSAIMDLVFESYETVFRDNEIDDGVLPSLTTEGLPWPAVPDKISQGVANMEDNETRRKIIREWMALPKDKRYTEEQVVAFAKKATQQNQFHRSRRDPDHKFRRDSYQKVMRWVLPRAGKP